LTPVRPLERASVFCEQPHGAAANCGDRETELVITNLGRTHITRVELDVPGLPLPVGVAA
jgi:hypothetical protein